MSIYAKRKFEELWGKNSALNEPVEYGIAKRGKIYYEISYDEDIKTYKILYADFTRPARIIPYHDLNEFDTLKEARLHINMLSDFLEDDHTKISDFYPKVHIIPVAKIEQS